MYSFDRADELDKILKKLMKRDKGRFEAGLKKIGEICENPKHKQRQG